MNEESSQLLACHTETWRDSYSDRKNVGAERQGHRYGGHRKMRIKRDIGKWRTRWQYRAIGKHMDKDKCGKKMRLRDRDRVGTGEVEKDSKSRGPGRLHEEPQA